MKDETFALLKKNVKITKERIPAATQLFTPDWIVRYMVENSLGRLWYEGHSDFDKSQWKYYLDEAEQDHEVEEQLKKIRAEYAQIRPEEIKVIDPCMGSGHILVYAFDVLMQIYTSAGWSERDAAKSILENNLYGLDIDDRAGQLAYFAVMMKARKHNRRILNGEVKPNVLSIQESNWMTDEFISYVAGKDANMKANLVMLRKTFKDAKEYGSILNVPEMQYGVLYERIDIISKSYVEDLFQAQYKVMAVEQLLPLVKQSQIMSQKYEVITTNPPYMGNSGMSERLDKMVKQLYPDSKADLFAVFIEKCNSMLCQNGIQSMITQHAWMFLSSYEKLRKKLYQKDFVNMTHLGPRAFEEIGGEVVQTTSFVVRNSRCKGYLGSYIRLVDAPSQNEKEALFLSKRFLFIAQQDIFSSLPGGAFAYWLSNKWIKVFKSKKIRNYGTAQEGIKTGDNNRFLRNWYEVSLCNTNIFAPNNNMKWQKTSKAGEHRRWYGSHYELTNFENCGQAIIATGHGSVTGRENLYKPAITWNRIATNKLAFRWIPEGFISNMGGLCLYPFSEDQMPLLLAFLNSKIAEKELNVINPTMSFPPGTINAVALDIEASAEKNALCSKIAINNIEIAKANWDSQELSWDFKKHPLI